VATEQEYFADGMVEDIITALSRFKSLFVIAAQFELHLQGPTVDIKEVGRRLGVRYVLEGLCGRRRGKLHHRAVDRCGYRLASMGGQV
jgi:adenylate cyclase